MRKLEQMDLDWIVRRLPQDVSALLWQRGPEMFLAGGFIRAVVANETVNDIDLFSPTKDAARDWSRFLAAKRHLGASDTYVTDNAITLHGAPPVQFIHHWTFKDPEDCIQSFDFTIAKAVVWWNRSLGKEGAWDSRCDDRFYSDLAAKRLVYTGPKREEAAGGSMLRVLKFYQRGYRIDMRSLGAVIARMAAAALPDADESEERTAKRYEDLLHEVDPAIDPNHMSHLPSEKACDDAP